MGQRHAPGGQLAAMQIVRDETPNPIGCFAHDGYTGSI
jgi:hypothetical protein